MNANFVVGVSFHPCKLEILLEKKLAAFLSSVYRFFAIQISLQSLSDSKCHPVTMASVTMEETQAKP